MDGDSEAVLSFWLDEVGPRGWYRRDDALDRAVAERFGALWHSAAAGGHRRWMTAPRSALALLIVLDQFPRNLFRGTARAFASDGLALTSAKSAIRSGHDRAVAGLARQFFYLPLMHSEVQVDQDRCVRLMVLRLPEDRETHLDHAVKHRAVIRRFGRFPSRNAALGRPDRPEEIAYREGGGYMG